MNRQSNAVTWTYDQKVQFTKEVITGVLALMVVGSTLYWAGRTFSMAGDSTRMGDAKDLLAFLSGFAGVVVGYYFGRVPADARASQAQEQVEQAVAQRENTKSAMGETQKMLEEMAERGEQVTVDHVRKVRELTPTT